MAWLGSLGCVVLMARRRGIELRCSGSSRGRSVRVAIRTENRQRRSHGCFGDTGSSVRRGRRCQRCLAAKAKSRVEKHRQRRHCVAQRMTASPCLPVGITTFLRRHAQAYPRPVESAAAVHQARNIGQTTSPGPGSGSGYEPPHKIDVGGE